jgi:hypothetical protein
VFILEIRVHFGKLNIGQNAMAFLLTPENRGSTVLIKMPWHFVQCSDFQNEPGFPK